MQTRRSERIKRYTVEKYDFDLSSDDDQVKRRRRIAKGKKVAVDGTADKAVVEAEEAEEEAEEEVDEGEEGEEVEGEEDEEGEEGEEEEEDEDEEEADEDEEEEEQEDEEEEEAEEEEDDDEGLELSSVAAGASGAKKLSHRREKSTKDSGYLDIEPVPPEGQHKGYVGPYDRGMRGKALVRAWYGPQQERIEMAHQLLERWRGWTVLPPKVAHDEDEPTDRGFWSPDAFEDEGRLAQEWWASAKPALTQDGAWEEVSAEESLLYQMPPLSMPVLIGQYDAQQQVNFETNCYALSHNGVPFDQDNDPEKVASGWILDVGGLVFGMDWVPRRHKNPRQLLALAVIPHADQEFYNFEEASMDPNFQKYGVVQIWEFTGTTTDQGHIRPSTENAVRLRTLCFEYGRVRRVKWSPACHHLAALCGDGSVCIVDVGDLELAKAGAYYKVRKPLALLKLLNEYSIEATCMTWINCNRIAVGYSDGSIALWSIYPCRLLSRHPVHHNHIIDMVSGYPTMPNLVASVPVGGTARLIDLQAPSYETTEVQKPLVHTQPGMLSYSDHMLGFISTYPSASALNTVVGFLHHAHFPIVRRVFTGDSFINCLAIGRLHPYLLLGAADGSLWSLNAQTDIFSSRQEATDRIRILQHEHRSAALFPPDSPAAVRGVSRILQGFSKEKNRNSKPESKLVVKKSAKLRKPKDAPDAAAAAEEEDDDEVADLTDPSRAVLHEPRTRITTIEWNPNEDYGCWAAVAMASGLVRVIDLGLERFPEGTSR